MKIKLNNDISIDLPTLIETRLLVQANSGGGKSYTIRRIIEQAFGKVQIIVLDPEGEYTNLREKFDFVYAGKGGDAPVEARSAAMLAHRLLELKASAIIDLYELSPQERKLFVRLFCDSMVNAPKELWHEVLVIVDEAHIFAPEKDESEALGAIIDLASRGRKRGYAAILATQRPAKLNKDAAAECNNKLIGRSSLDIDRKRSAEELGFTTKDDVRALRDLEPGEFYVFGPAISREVKKIRIGDVQVKPPPRGVARAFNPPPPTAKVKKILAQLADLPEAAAKEARTVKELKDELAGAKREITILERGSKTQAPDPEAIKRLTDKAYNLGVAAVEHRMRDEIRKAEDGARNDVKKYMGILRKIASLAAPFIGNDIAIDIPKFNPVLPPQRLEMHREPYRPSPEDRHTVQVLRNDLKEAGKGEMKVLAALASYDEGMTRNHITVATGYKRSTRDAYIQRLLAKGYVEIFSDNKIVATPAGISTLGSNYKPLPTGRELAEYHLGNLPEGEAKILEVLLDSGAPVSRDELTERTGYKRSTRDAYLQRLQARELVDESGPGMVEASSFLLA